MRVWDCYSEPNIAVGFKRMFPTADYVLHQLQKQIIERPKSVEEALHNREITKKIRRILKI